MGRLRKKNKGAKASTDAGGQAVSRPKPTTRSPYTMTCSNAAFSEYYRAQGIAHSPEDFEAMLTAFQTTLPVTFRINGSLSFAENLRDYLVTHHFPALKAVVERQLAEAAAAKVAVTSGTDTPLPESTVSAPDSSTTGSSVQEPTPSNTPTPMEMGAASEASATQQDMPPRIEHIPCQLAAPCALKWYPRNLGWQVSVSRQVMKKTPEWAEFHRFLMAETDTGNISRSEAVSMMPPLFLDVQPHHYVLDMCAAPGSKTSQLIEALHTGPATSADKAGVSRTPAGLLIANDADLKRSQMLVHQIKRIASPCVMVTHHEAQFFPKIMLRPGNAYESAASDVPMDAGDLKYLTFDRILADVPCSGDGTLRKNLGIWKSWSVRDGLGLHVLQKAILLRATQLLNVGGRIVYSTCSLNPLENEAIVADCLRSTHGGMQIVDASNMVSNLISRPGLTTWKVPDKYAEGVFHSRFEDLPTPTPDSMSPSMFPPSAEEAAKWGLHHAMRIMPQDQDTGAFFVCVLEKVAPIWRLDGPNYLLKDVPMLQNETADGLPLTDADRAAREAGSELKAQQIIARKKRKRDAEMLKMQSSKGPARVETPAGGQMVTSEATSTPAVTPDATSTPAVTPEATSAPSVNPKATSTLAVKTPAATPEAPKNSAITPEASTTPAVTSVTAADPAAVVEAPAPNPAAGLVGWVNPHRPADEPLILLPPNSPAVAAMVQAYAVSPDFPRDQFIVRTISQDPNDHRTLYFISQSVKPILSAPGLNRLRVLSAGIRCFGRADGSLAVRTGGTAAATEAACQFRVYPEGMDTVFAHLGARVVRIARADLAVLLQHLRPTFAELSPATAAALRAVSYGCVVLHCVDDGAEDGPHARRVLPIVCSAFRAQVSISLLVNAAEKKSMYRRLTGKELLEILDVPAKPAAGVEKVSE